MINANLTKVTLEGKAIPKDVREAFLLDKDMSRCRIKEVPNGSYLWKFTQYGGFNKHDGLSPWWCPVQQLPGEDNESLLEVLHNAQANGVDPAVYIRLISAVTYHWNALTSLQVIRVRESAKGLWGQFTPQPLRGPDVPVVLPEEVSHLPDMLGGAGAWQFWIPNLNKHNSSIEFESTDRDLIYNYSEELCRKLSNLN